ncbi:hypothetical protein KKF92_04835 [Patescibacteria group bacterium]|nr:hypothetical protein [Patescibacteria group bacterium]
MHLSRIQHDLGSITLLDLSCLAELISQSQSEKSLPNQKIDLSTIINSSSQALTEHVSGVIFEPINGFEAITQKNDDCGLALALTDKSEQHQPTELPTFYPNWGVEFVRHNYGLAYLKLFYHPGEPKASEKIQLVAEVYDHCLYEGIDLVLEISLFALNDQKNTLEEFQEAQLLAVQDFRDKCHLMALEYAHSALACATLTAQLDVPWILVDRTPNYAEFKEQVRIAMESGAMGATLGQVLWQGLEVDQYQQAVTTTVRDRVIELDRIIQESLSAK